MGLTVLRLMRLARIKQNGKGFVDIVEDYHVMGMGGGRWKLISYYGWELGWGISG
jgi:hypothetical protein